MMTRTRRNTDTTQPILQPDCEVTQLVTWKDYTVFKEDVIADAEWSIIHAGQLNPSNEVLNIKKSPILLAVKMPKSRQSAQVLQEEARILNRLRNYEGHDRFVVDFLGFDAVSGAVLLEKMDLSLQNYVRDVIERTEQRELVVKKVFPSIALQLVHGLAWLHNTAKVVHGDIKPTNILLKRIPDTGIDRLQGASFPYRAVLADFGSSRLMNENRKPKCSNTREFMAPENMSSAASEAPPTPEGDVWAMGITLLTVITGRTPYYRLSWPSMFSILRDGNPIMHEGNASSLVRERLDANQKFVEMISPALDKSLAKRIKAKAWCEMLDKCATAYM